MTHEGLKRRTIATYLSLLGTICNAAVDTGYLDRSPSPPPGHRRRRPATLTATPVEPSPPRRVWLTRPQVEQLADAIDPATALVILAAHTGARWSELTTLRWTDVRTNYPLDDGAVSGPGRLRIRPPTPVDEEEPASHGRSRSRPSGRHRPRPARHRRPARPPRPGRRPQPGLHQPRRHPLPQRPTLLRQLRPRLAARLVRRRTGPGRARPAAAAVPRPALHPRSLAAGPAGPIGAIARRLGHASPVVTMRMYQLAAILVAEGRLTTCRKTPDRPPVPAAVPTPGRQIVRVETLSHTGWSGHPSGESPTKPRVLAALDTAVQTVLFPPTQHQKELAALWYSFRSSSTAI